MDVVLKLNGAAWMNCPSQLQRMNPPPACCDDLEPSKLILMDPN